MKVLIVAKTKVGPEVCIGGLDEGGHSLRLKEADGSFPSLSAYEVGDIWEVVAKKPNELIPPHVETVHVTSRKKLGVEGSITKKIRSLMKNPWVGRITALYDGKLGFTGNAHGYIEAPNIPSRSTWFWLPDKDLEFANNYYRYAPYEVKYVGVAPPVTTIKSGTLVRVSLASWWKQRDAADDFPERCYLQLSGWYV